MNQRFNYWIFGDNARLEFNGNTPPTVPAAGHAMNGADKAETGCACICDDSGTPLLYSNGLKVWDGAGNVIPTGTSLLSTNTGHRAQEVIIVPNPADGSEYYILTTSGNHKLDGVLLSNSGSGWNSTSANVPQGSSHYPTPRTLAIQHANGRDFWILTVVQKNSTNPQPSYDRDDFLRTYLLNESGIHLCREELIGGGAMFAHGGVWRNSCMSANRAGTKIALSTYDGKSVMYFPFDRAVGSILINDRHTIWAPNVSSSIPDHPELPYGVEFSADGRYLFFVLRGYWRQTGAPGVRSTLHRVDTDDPGFPVELLGSYEHNLSINAYSASGLRLGPDDKIYISHQKEHVLSVITKPSAPLSYTPTTFTNTDIAKDASGDKVLEWNAITLGTGANAPTSETSLPNIVHFAPLSPCAELREETNELISAQHDQYANTLIECTSNTAPSCDPQCDLVSVPDIKPMISIKWGNTSQTTLSAPNQESMTITVCSCYSNVTFKNFTIERLEVQDLNGNPVGTVAGGTLSLADIFPMGPYCFGEIGPCGCGSDGNHCVSREFILQSNEALSSDLKIVAKGICFSACFNYSDEACFFAPYT